MDKLPYQTLHCHTTTSDGLLTHQQVLDECEKNKIGVVAFTDHDSVPKPETLDKLKKMNHLVKFATGIEISCDFLPEVSEKLSTFHVTGLFVNPTNAGLIEFCQKALASRQERLRKFVNNLRRLGFEISEKEVLEFAKGEAIGRPHIVAALELHNQNKKILEGFYQELVLVAKEDDLRRQQLEMLNNMLPERRERQKWYVLVMTEEALHSVYVNYRDTNLISMDDAVKTIRAAGGLAQIAHWSYLRDKITLPILETILSSHRLDGLETVYGFGDDKFDYFLRDMQDLARLCDKYNLIQGGGGDFHRPEDFALMLNPNSSVLAERTRGMVEKILQLRPDLDLSWSSLSR